MRTDRATIVPVEDRTCPAPRGACARPARRSRARSAASTTTSAAASSTCVAGLVAGLPATRTRPSAISCWACSRDRARPRRTSSASSRRRAMAATPGCRDRPGRRPAVGGCRRRPPPARTGVADPPRRGATPHQPRVGPMTSPTGRARRGSISPPSAAPDAVGTSPRSSSGISVTGPLAVRLCAAPSSGPAAAAHAPPRRTRTPLDPRPDRAPSAHAIRTRSAPASRFRPGPAGHRPKSTRLHAKAWPTPARLTPTTRLLVACAVPMPIAV